MRTLRQFGTFQRPVQLLLLNQLTIMIGFSMLMPYLTSYLSTARGFAAWMVGLVLGLRTFSQQGLCIVGGTLADHVGYTSVIAGGCALRMAGFLLFGFCDSLPSALAAAFLSGLGGALFAPAVRAYLASESGAQRVEAFALFTVCEAVGACIGPLLSVALFRSSFRLVCIIASGIFLVGILFTVTALLSILLQAPLTAYVKVRWHTLQAISIGLALMGGAFLPLLATRPFLPLSSLQVTIGNILTVPDVLIAAINLSPTLVGAVLLTLGTMLVQPFTLSLIPVLSGNRLLGTYFGVYYLVQGSGAVVGNLIIGAAFDMGKTLGFQSFPWLLLLGLGLAWAASITTLDRKERAENLLDLPAYSA